MGFHKLIIRPAISGGGTWPGGGGRLTSHDIILFCPIEHGGFVDLKLKCEKTSHGK